MVTRRRSATGVISGPEAERAGASVAGRVAGPAPAAWSGLPHSLQKRAPGAFEAPQDGQPEASRDPQLLQNFAPPGFSVPQLPQTTRPDLPQ